MLPLEIASELDRLTGCNEVKSHDRMKMKALDPDCHFIADMGEMSIRRFDERPFSHGMFEKMEGHSGEGYESDDESDENEMLVGEFVEDMDLEVEKRNNE